MHKLQITAKVNEKENIKRGIAKNHVGSKKEMWQM